MWVEALTLGLATAGLIYINWDKWFPKKEIKSIPLEQVIKEAESALQYNPLADAKNKPEAVKPLLRVLLEIREKKAEMDLWEEEHKRQREEEKLKRDLALAQARAEIRAIAARCPLSGRIDEGHPHFPFTAEGRRVAEQHALMAQQNINPKYQAVVHDLNKQLENYVNAPRYDVPPEDQQNTAIGYNALSAVESKNTIVGLGAITGAVALGMQAFYKHKRR